MSQRESRGLDIPLYPTRPPQLMGLSGKQGHPTPALQFGGSRIKITHSTQPKRPCGPSSS